jgi:mannose-6-phosphate isomerase
VDLLHNTVQRYAWGSATAIPDLLGVPNPDGEPQAELWMGAHPNAPSAVTREGREQRLDQLIGADPGRLLGARTAERFGGRLPFLLKILAAGRALSIQLHPDRVQAEAGFAAEEARGVPRDARHRVYVDDWPKPEILCALTPFEVLAGLRPAGEAADLLARLTVPDLADLVEGLRAEPEPAQVAAALAALLRLPDEQRVKLADEVVAAAGKTAPNVGTDTARGAYELVGRLARDFPGDIGVVCSLLMEHQVLQPGQALFMAAGGIHAYVQGTGVELLANSDNVIRAGLTPKHIDVPELLRILDPTVPVPVLAARSTGAGVEQFDTGIPEFLLRRLTVGAGGPLAVPGEGEPRILLCVGGEAEITAGGRRLALTRGRSCFLAADDPAATLTGEASLFLAAPGAVG